VEFASAICGGERLRGRRNSKGWAGGWLSPRRLWTREAAIASASRGKLAFLHGHRATRQVTGRDRDGSRKCVIGDAFWIFAGEERAGAGWWCVAEPGCGAERYPDHDCSTAGVALVRGKDGWRAEPELLRRGTSARRPSHQEDAGVEPGWAPWRAGGVPPHIPESAGHGGAHLFLQEKGVESRPFTWRMSAVGRPEIWSFWPNPGLSRAGWRRPLRGYALDRPGFGQGELGIQGGRETGRSGLSRSGAFYSGGHEIT